ncbi:MAG: ATP-binding protein [Oscillospiraceae bacterium]
MRINKMTATFGKLKNSTLELEPGLNIINAPNEHGKSTWCGFINAMLYGIDSSERDRNGYLSAKNRFRPWDGGAMIGTMEITSGGRDITIQRTTKGASPMKNFIAVYSGTADFIKTVTGDTAGEEFTGVSKQVFERTAFIRRPDIRVGQTSELEKRIASMVSSGDESTSYTEADSQLRAWQRKLRHNQTGSLPALYEELKDAEHRFALIESSSEEISNLRGNMDRLKKQIELMERDLEIHDKLDKRAAARRVAEARAAALSAEERVKKLTEAVTKNGHRMTREDINSIRETASAVIPLRGVASDAEKALWQAEKELSDATAKRKSSPLNGRSEDSVAGDVALARELEEKVKHIKERKIPKWIPTVLVCMAVLGLLVTSGFLYPFSDWIPAVEPYFGTSVFGLIISAAVLALGVALFFIKPPKKRTAADDLKELLEKYGVSSADKLASHLSSYSAVCREENEKRSARDAAKLAFDSASEAAKAAGDKAVEQLSAFMPEVTSGEGVIAALGETEKLIDELTHAEFDMISSQNVYETLLAGFDENEDIDESYLPIPIRNREDTLAAMSRAQAQLTDATRAYDLATGAQHTLGDPAVIEGEIQSLKERIAEETRRYNALGLAVDVLSEANTELQTRFSPLISKKASEIMGYLTGGRYEKLVFDRGFDAGAKLSGEPENRNVLSLSEGTGDEIYFSLRLAMCALILGGDDPCPIILDDALSNFDDERCNRALELLLELSKSRQILLFTCHSRESEYMRGRAGVKFLSF